MSVWYRGPLTQGESINPRTDGPMDRGSIHSKMGGQGGPFIQGSLYPTTPVPVPKLQEEPVASRDAVSTGPYGCHGFS